MKYMLLISEEQLAHLRDVMMLDASDCSRAFIEAMNTDDKLRTQQARVAFMRASVILAMLDDPAPVAESVPTMDAAPVMPYTHAELKAAKDAGLDVDKEYGPINPQAFRPRCVHGLYFTETCEHCDRATIDGDAPV